MSTTVTDAIKQAQEAAAASVNQQVAATGQATVASVGGVQNSAVAIPGQKLTMDQVGGQMSVDHWIGVKEFGITIGQDKHLHPESLRVTIDMTAVQPAYAAKYGNNPVTYIRTYDRVTETRGGSWNDALSLARRIDPKIREYPSVDIPMTLLQDITKGDKVIAERGQRLGHSTATTNWGEWELFYNDLKKKGLHTSTVTVDLGFIKRAKNGNTWGLLTFTHVPE